MICAMLYLSHGFFELLIADKPPSTGRHWKSGSQRSHMEFQDVVAAIWRMDHLRERSLPPSSLN